MILLFIRLNHDRSHIFSPHKYIPCSFQSIDNMARFYTFIFLFFASLTPSCKKEIPSIKPELKSITASVYASGIVKSRNQYNIFSSVNGVIKTILVKEGDVIRKGDPIMIIQNLTAMLNTENVRLSADYNMYERNEDKLLQIQKEIELANRKLKSDSLLMSRQNNLWAQGIGTKTEQEQRELTYQNAKTTYENLKIKYRDVKKQLKYASTQSKNNLQISKSTLGDFTIKSELNGRVYSITKEIGEMVSTQSPLGVIGDDSHYILELQLDEYDIIKIREGQEVIVKLDSYQDSVFEAKVTKLNPLMNEKTRTFVIEAEFIEKPSILYPNLSVEANIVLTKKENIITLPRKYIIEDKYVILKDGSKREIKTGIKDYLLAEIIEGIDISTEVILPK
jgi:HlyD family secretion protein